MDVSSERMIGTYVNKKTKREFGRLSTLNECGVAEVEYEKVLNDPDSTISDGS